MVKVRIFSTFPFNSSIFSFLKNLNKFVQNAHIQQMNRLTVRRWDIVPADIQFDAKIRRSNDHSLRIDDSVGIDTEANVAELLEKFVISFNVAFVQVLLVGIPVNDLVAGAFLFWNNRQIFVKISLQSPVSWKLTAHG